MRSFVFESPTKVIFGKNSLPKLGAQCRQIGNKVLWVYGQQSLKQNNTYKHIRQSLADSNLTIFEHGGVQPNPTTSPVRQGIELARAHNIQLILGTGGGSVMDTAKAIAAGALAEHDVWQLFRGKKGIRQALPVITVPTVAGSGSETNSGMVLTNDESRIKLGIGNKCLFPKVAILDPTLTFSVPQSLTATGAVDTLCHLLEFYFNREEEYSPLQDHYSEAIMTTVMESAPVALTHPKDYDARANLMWASSLALNGLSSAGLGWVGFPIHMIEHAISGRYETSHGAGLAALLRGWLNFQRDHIEPRLAMFSRRVLKVREGSCADVATHGIDELMVWLRRMNLPSSLTELNIPRDDIPKIAKHALTQAKLWRLRDYDEDKITAILANSY